MAFARKFHLKGNAKINLCCTYDTYLITCVCVYRIVSGVAGLVEQSTPFFAVKTLITRLLDLDKCHNAHERENLILFHVSKEPGLSNMLPLLNDLLMVKVRACTYV